MPKILSQVVDLVRCYAGLGDFLEVDKADLYRLYYSWCLILGMTSDHEQSQRITAGLWQRFRPVVDVKARLGLDTLQAEPPSVMQTGTSRRTFIHSFTYRCWRLEVMSRQFIRETGY
jgi:hypothetical protein